MTSSRQADASGSVRRPRHRRCAVRVSYSRNRTAGQRYAHGRYIEREGGTADGIAKALGEWQKSGDQRLFKIILSPEFGERMDSIGRPVSSWNACRATSVCPWSGLEPFTGTQTIHTSKSRFAASTGYGFRGNSIKHGLWEHAENPVHRPTRLSHRAGCARVETPGSERSTSDFAGPPKCPASARRGLQRRSGRSRAVVGTNGPGTID
jgi:hypothetical protein